MANAATGSTQTKSRKKNNSPKTETIIVRLEKAEIIKDSCMLTFRIIIDGTDGKPKTMTPYQMHWQGSLFHQGSTDSDGMEVVKKGIPYDSDIDYMDILTKIPNSAAKSFDKFFLPKGPEKAKSQTFVQKVEIKPIGRDGNYTINIQIVNNQGTGSKCKIIMTEEDNVLNNILPLTANQVTNRNYQLKKDTNDAGFLSIRLNTFTEKRRVILVQVENTDVDKTLVLKGPKPKTEYRHGHGFWAHLMQDFN